MNELRSQLRESIYTVKIAHGQLAESIEKLDVEVKAIDDLLENCNPPGQGHDFSTLNRDFRSLEQHAAELADLLEALVRHYDLCITAIKHTEGGGDLIEQVKIELPEGTDIRSLEHLSPPQPMDDEERAEMMQVLDKDAAEVEDVVQEISDHAAEMEAQLQRINSHLATLQSEHNMLSKSSTLLDGLGGRLGSFIQVCADYKSCWDVEKHKIEDKLVEFEAAREFYEGFLQAYDGLILEVARRKAVKGKMRKIMHDAMAKVGRLYNGKPCICDLRFTSDKAQRRSRNENRSSTNRVSIYPPISGLGSVMHRRSMLSRKQKTLDEHFPKYQRMFCAGLYREMENDCSERC